MHVKKVSIILPAYNEEKGIVTTLQSLPLRKLKLLGYKPEVIVIDNNSSDKTAFFARKYGAKVFLEKKQGYGYAYKKGFSVSTGEMVICMDSDGTYPGEAVEKMVKLLEGKCDLVVGNRLVLKGSSEMKIINRLGNWFLSWCIRLLFGINLQDSQSGMWGIKRSILKKLKLRSNSMAMCQELKIDVIFYEGAKWKEFNIKYFKRVGESKLFPLKNGMENLVFLVAKRVQR